MPDSVEKAVLRQHSDDNAIQRGPGATRRAVPESIVIPAAGKSSLPESRAVSTSTPATPAPIYLLGGPMCTLTALAIAIFTLHAIIELSIMDGERVREIQSDAGFSLWGLVEAVHSALRSILPVRLLPVAAQRVFWCAWITDACTGAGALPFLLARGGGESLSARWVAAANAIAGGMMLAASGLLIVEAATFEMPGPRPAAGAARTPLDALAALPSAVHMLLGLGAGVAFVRGSQSLLHRYEHLKFHGFKGARRGEGRGLLT